MNQQPPGTSTRIRVFHVDDEPDSRRLMSILIGMEPDLEEAGSAADGRSLLEALASARPDVLVIDLVMHGPDPIAIIRDVRAAHPQMRIVVYSGHDDPRLLEKATAAGASCCVTKGIDTRNVFDAIRGTKERAGERRAR